MKALDVFLDEELLRVGSRICDANLSFGTRFPIVLEPHRLTILIIEQIHAATLHERPRLMLHTLYRKYWILQARTQVRACVQNCVICAKYRDEKRVQKMADSPRD